MKKDKNVNLLLKKCMGVSDGINYFFQHNHYQYRDAKAPHFNYNFKVLCKSTIELLLPHLNPHLLFNYNGKTWNQKKLSKNGHAPYEALLCTIRVFQQLFLQSENLVSTPDNAACAITSTSQTTNQTKSSVPLPMASITSSLNYDP